MITHLRLKPVLILVLKISKVLDQMSFEAQVKSRRCIQEWRGAMKIRGGLKER